MPELPEVETIVRGLKPHLIGMRIEKLKISPHRLRFEYPENFIQGLVGRKIINASRRAKYILLGLDNDTTWVIHLGMSGRLSLIKSGQSLQFDDYVYNTGENNKHDHVIIDLKGEDKSDLRLIYNDPRRFGLMDLSDTLKLETARHFAHLGPEPLDADFNGQTIKARLKNCKQAIKVALLNQEHIVGLGNIYVCEALHMSHISPMRPANSLHDDEAELLAANIVKVLKTAIDAGGSTLKDFRHSDGNIGSFQERFLAYDRENKPCQTPGCEGIISRIIQGGRSTFFCPKCQK